MNSAIQALLGLNMFVEKMKMYADDGQGLLQAFSQLCLACTKGEMVIANQGMIEMKRQFELMDKQFEGSKMQDSSEFLCKALEKMSEIEKQRLSSIPKLTLTMGELDIVANYFQHVKEVTIVCHGCKSETKCKQSDMTMWSDTVSMSIMTRTRSMSLQQLLEQSLAEEVIERRCDKCGCEEATTSCRLLKLPRVLIIILKRFSYSEQDQTVSNKVSRLVDIPETLSLSLVADTVSLPSPSLSHDDDTLTSTPAKTGHATTLVETPAKFKWLDVEKVESLNEEDQYEYMLYVSRKEAVDNQMNRSGADEDADLKAALEASMREDHFNHSDQSGGFDNVMSGGFPASTSARKRSYGQLGGGLFTHGDGDRSREKINKAMDYMDLKENDAAKERAKVHKTTNPRSRVRSSPRKKQEAKVPRPKSKDQEEADLQRALDLSRQEHESVLEDTTFEWAMEDVENNNTQEVARPEHSYQLHSVVSHLGAGARSGHYVADVFRFDGGGWLRYDDARITRTNGVAVRWAVVVIVIYY
jgi:ubiquitin carboxyl-terminal hydrolase 26/29/37